MGIKLLIAQACLIAGEEVATHADVADVVEVSKDEALYLCRIGRAYYVDKGDDPTKGTLTAGKEEIERCKREAAAASNLAKERVLADQLSTPSGQAAMIGAAVAKAVQAALAQPAKPATA